MGSWSPTACPGSDTVARVRVFPWPSIERHQSRHAWYLDAAGSLGVRCPEIHHTCPEHGQSPGEASMALRRVFLTGRTQARNLLNSLS